MQRTSAIPEFLASIITNSQAAFDLRLRAARHVVEGKKVELYKDVLDFLRETSRHRTSEAYSTGVRPLVELFGRTGKEGLALAVRAFLDGDLGPHAPMILASFEGTFHDWFFKNNPAPSRAWVRVLIEAWFRAPHARSRMDMLAVLVDHWSNRTDLAHFVIEKLRRKLRDRPTYLAPAGAMAERVREYVNAGEDWEEYELETAERILQAAVTGGEAWDAITSEQPHERIDGRAAVAAYAQVELRGRPRILRWIQTRTNARFRSSAYSCLLNPSLFGSLGRGPQLAILRSPGLRKLVNTVTLERLVSGRDLEPDVRGRIQELLDDMVRDHRLGRPDKAEEGELS